MRTSIDLVHGMTAGCLPLSREKLELASLGKRIALHVPSRMTSSLLCCRFLLCFEGFTIVEKAEVGCEEFTVDSNVSVELGEVIIVECVKSESVDIGLKVGSSLSCGSCVRLINVVQKVVCSEP